MNIAVLCSILFCSNGSFRFSAVATKQWQRRNKRQNVLGKSHWLLNIVTGPDDKSVTSNRT